MKISLVFSCAASCAALLAGAPLAHAQNAVAQNVVAPTEPKQQQNLNATLWVQRAAESKIADRQAYVWATRQLDVALGDKRWSAATEQTPGYEKLPPAVILDLDETVLDNSPYFARLVRDDGTLKDDSWDVWVEEKQAEALPGAVAFLKYANSRGVQIFYVSNRDARGEAATRANLNRLGLPVQGDAKGPNDHVLLKDERPAWTSDKSSRRAWVAKNHRVLIIIGDDLNDFVSARKITLDQRLNLVSKYAPYWGERWVLLSNPLYGSWEDTINGYDDDISLAQMLRRKYDLLDPREPKAAPKSAPTSSR